MNIGKANLMKRNMNSSNVMRADNDNKTVEQVKQFVYLGDSGRRRRHRRGHQQQAN